MQSARAKLSKHGVVHVMVTRRGAEQVYGAVTMNNTLCLGLFLLVRCPAYPQFVPVLRREGLWSADSTFVLQCTRHVEPPARGPVTCLDCSP